MTKVIQLIDCGLDFRMIALCEDGSIWWFDPREPMEKQFEVIKSVKQEPFVAPKAPFESCSSCDRIIDSSVITCPHCGFAKFRRPV